MQANFECLYRHIPARACIQKLLDFSTYSFQSGLVPSSLAMALSRYPQCESSLMFMGEVDWLPSQTTCQVYVMPRGRLVMPIPLRELFLGTPKIVISKCTTPGDLISAYIFTLPRNQISV